MTPIPNHPLGYESPPPGSDPRRSRFSAPLFGITLGFMCLLLTIITLVIPRVELVYRDFGVKLPGITQIVLDAARPVAGIPAWIGGLLVAIAAAYVVATLPVGGRALRLVLVVVFAILVCCVALAIFLPMIHLIDGVAGTGKP